MKFPMLSPKHGAIFQINTVEANALAAAYPAGLSEPANNHPIPDAR